MKRKQFVKAGCILLAAVVLGTGAWVTEKKVNDQIPELTTFVDVEELVSIGEEEVPLASAPKVTVKTKKTKKVVRLKTKAKRTEVKKKTTKKTNTTQKQSQTEKTTTKVETTKLVTEKYKKGSDKKVVNTTTKIKTTVTVMELAAAKEPAVNHSAAAPVTQKAPASGVVEIAAIAPLVDTRIKTAYEALGFTIEINPTVSYAGYFTAREQKITLQRNDDTIYHELGHFLAFVAGNVDVKPDFMAVYQAEKDLMTGVRKAYATQNSSEYFAESFREYTLDPVTLQNQRPQTYQSIVNALNVVTETQTSRILAVYGAFWNNNK